MTENKKPKKQTEEEIKKLVVARIKASMSPNMRLSVGMGGRLDMEELIDHVNKEDEVGKQIIQAHLNFLKAQSSGELTKVLNTV
ncbi:MAG: hypothetical protein ACOC1P_03965 [Minisyncoccales bacterium]